MFILTLPVADSHISVISPYIYPDSVCVSNIPMLSQKKLIIVLFFLCLPFRSLWKHFRAVSLCLFLLIFPAYMAYMICQFFHMDFWLLIIISSSILTSLQVNIHT